MAERDWWLIQPREGLVHKHAYDGVNEDSESCRRNEGKQPKPRDRRNP